MKYPFPVKLPNDLSIVVSQVFKADSAVNLSEALSVTTKTHNGVDITCGTNEQTWGKECVWSLPWDGVVYKSKVDSQFGATQSAHAQIDTTDPATGIQYSVIYLHLSAVTNTKLPTDSKVVIYKQGDVIGKIGNNGFVVPAPTPLIPLNGSHLHLGLGVKKPGEINYTMVDPLTLFDVNKSYRTELSTPPEQNMLPSARLLIVGNQMMATNPTQARIVLAVAQLLKAFNS